MSETTIIPPPRAMRRTGIKNLSPSLPERGKIKIGRKGKERQSANGKTWAPPEKQDHFTITTLERGPDGNFLRDEAMHAQLGDKPTEIPVRLLYDDPTLNLMTRYAVYKGRTLWCSGDGEVADRLSDDGKQRVEVECPCYRQDPAYEGKDKCKINGVLSALIEGASGIGGVWKFRTTSYNSVVGLSSTMAFLRSISAGPLAGLPLMLTLRPKQAASPVDGSPVTVYVVGLEFRGSDAELRAIGHKVALERASAHVSIQMIEAEARRLLMAPAAVPLPGDDADDIVAEFYPEQVADAAPERPKRSDFTDATSTEPAIAALPFDEASPTRHLDFGKAMAAVIRAAGSLAEIEAHVRANQDLLLDTSTAAPKVYAKLAAVLDECRTARHAADELEADRLAREFAGQGDTQGD